MILWVKNSGRALRGGFLLHVAWAELAHSAASSWWPGWKGRSKKAPLPRVCPGVPSVAPLSMGSALCQWSGLSSFYGTTTDPKDGSCQGPKLVGRQATAFCWGGGIDPTHLLLEEWRMPPGMGRFHGGRLSRLHHIAKREI